MTVTVLSIRQTGSYLLDSDCHLLENFRSQRSFTLREDEVAQIEEEQRISPDPRVGQSATGLRLLHLGKKPAEVAELLNVSRATVFDWQAGWRAEGIDGLR